MISVKSHVKINRIAVVGMAGYLSDFTTTVFRMPRIGPVFIGSVLKDHGYNVRVFSEPVKRLTREHLQYIVSSDLIAMSVLTFGANRAYALARLIRQMNKTAVIVMGDVHATIMPEHCLDHCDVVIRGEGEATILELLDYLQGADTSFYSLDHIDGISFWKNGKKVHNPQRSRPHNIDTSIDFSIVDSFVQKDWKIKITEARQTMTVLQASRGCPVACKFCLGSSILGTEYRTKEIDAVIANLDMVRAYNLGKGPVIFFIDNHFFINKPWTKELLRRIIKENYDFRFIAFGQYFIGNDTEMLELLREAQFIKIFVGFESINPSTLRDWNKKQSEATMRKCINNMHETDIQIHGSFMLGGETDSEEIMDATIDFAIETDIATASFFGYCEYPFESYPGDYSTKILPTYRLLPDDLDFYNLNFVSIFPKLVRPSTLQRKLITAHERFYSMKRVWDAFVAGGKVRARQRFYGHLAQRKMVSQMYNYLPYLEKAEESKYDNHDVLIEETLDKTPKTFRDPHYSAYHDLLGVKPIENIIIPQLEGCISQHITDPVDVQE